jgi:3-hydroxymyristoyl/3-hydroxydecanoyl-(acyl carrier protein) dehydratase
MRYRFIDEIVTLQTQAPARIEVCKTFAAGDDAFSGPLGPDRVPNSLLLELLAMTGGHLVFHCLDRGRLPLLLKVQECRFEGCARPGVPLHARASLNGLDDPSAATVVAETSGEVLANGALVAAARLLFVCVTVPNMNPAAFGTLRGA